MPDDPTQSPARRIEDAAFRTLVASVVDYAIFMLDPHGNVATWNLGAQRIKGYAASDIIGQHFSRFYPDDDRQAGKPAFELEEAARDGRFEDEGWRIRSDGTRFWANVVITALRGDDGELMGFAKVTRDLTERRRAEDERLEVASQAARALERMGELALALAGARTTAQVARVVVDQGARVALADTCVLYMLDDAGSTLELIGDHGVAAEVVEAARSLTDTPTSGAAQFAAMRGGVNLWAETVEEYRRLFPNIASVKATGKRARAFWCTPLLVEQRTIGLLGMGFYDERPFAPGDRLIADTLAKQCAQALLRAKRLEQEERTQEWIATTLRSIGDAVIATDPAGHVTLMNAVAEQLTGWTEADAKGRALDEVFCIVSEQTRDRVDSPVAHVLRQGAVAGLTHHSLLRSKQGKELPVDDSAAPIRDAAGNLFGVVLVFRDTTAEKRSFMRRDFLARAGATLASSLDYRATLTGIAQLAVPQLADWCAIDILEPGASAPLQLAVAHVDPKKMEWARELGERYPPDPDALTGAPQVIRSGKAELYPEIPVALLEASTRGAEQREIIRELKLESAMVVPLRGRDRTLGAMTFIYADSGRRYTEDDLAFAEEFVGRAALAIENAWAMKETEQARVEERRLRREADIANRSKDEFLATVSHELRTPLNAIFGWTLILRERKLPADIEQPLAAIERNARRQLRLIEDVLDVSRIISGKLSLTPGPTNLGEVVDGAVEAAFPAAAAKAITVDVDVDRSITLTADRDRLQQVVWNLVSNAVKFSSKGGVVQVRAHRDGSDLSISVVDTGEGIAADVLPHIFEPFRQADASITRRHGGLGLGLAIVKQLVTAHGGTVFATSDGAGRGAKLVVRLPALSVAPSVEPTPRVARETTGTPAIPVALVAPRLDGLTVLVVDDESDARTIVEQVLRAQGAQVVTAESASKALEAFASLRPDVIVSDIGMPEMDGYTLLRTLRALPSDRGGRTPALALTAYARREDAQRAFAAGFQMHASKPVEPGELATLVANLGGRTME